MPAPPPLPDPHHIETRLLIVAEMLERAVAEVKRAMDDLAPKPLQPGDSDDPEDLED